MDNTSISILAQVVFKEMASNQRQATEKIDDKTFWEKHKEQTLELARNIIRLQKTINPTQ